MTASASALPALSDLTLPDLLRQPRPALQALQDKLLRRTIEICYRGHPFYAKLMRREKLEPRHIQSCEDLVRLPPTSKTDFLSDPEAFRLSCPDLSLEERTLWKVVYTTGTTSGNPAPVYVTTFDHLGYLHACGRPSGLIGIRETDTIANLFPLTPFPMGAYSRAPDEAASCGAGIVTANTGRSGGSYQVHRSIDEALGIVERHRATVLWGVASYVRRVLVRAAEVGANVSAVRMAMITGEASSHALHADMRRRMTELGCTDPLVVNRYGSTEQCASMVECTPGSGFHSMAPDQVFHEVVDADTGARKPDDESGMLAFTHLSRTGTVFLRYLVGDVVSLTNATCPHCGRTSPRISSQPTRSGDIVKIKGTLVNLQALKDQLEQLPGLDEYQIVVRKVDEHDPFSMDDLVVRIAAQPEIHDTVAATVISETKRTAYVRPRIERAAKDEIFDPSVSAKPRRIIDLRPKID